MEALLVRGGTRLRGELRITAAKNAVLPIIAASILTKDEVILKNCTPLSDVTAMLKIVRAMGGSAAFNGDVIAVNCAAAAPIQIDACLTDGIRSSIFILGPILSRFKSAVVNYPGGCEIGLRPIDLHIYGLKKLGVKIREECGHIYCDGSEMHGGEIDLDFPSVGATENVIMAAVTIDGRTVIRNAAREPEIADLADFINKMGGKIHGAGTDTVVIDGVRSLHGCTHTPIPDRIIAGTYLCGAAVTGGEINLKMPPVLLRSTLARLSACGTGVRTSAEEITLRTYGRRLRAIHKIETHPYPGFPTDMQAQLVAMLATARGTSMMVENLFESRFRYTAQLNKMGADITVKDRIAVINGVPRLSGGDVQAEDLRGGAALTVAALAAEGQTVVHSPRHIDRGYYKIENDLRALGADIIRVEV